MFLPWCFYVLLFGIHDVYAEVFSSVADLRSLLDAEPTAQKVLKSYVDTKTSSAATSVYDALNTPGVSVYHPVDAYHVVKRWYQLSVFFPEGSKLLQEIHDIQLPTDEDVTGAAEGLIRLQRTYNISTEHLALGQVYDHQSVQSLSIDDFFTLGEAAMATTDYGLAAQWFDMAVTRKQQQHPEEMMQQENQQQHAEQVKMHDQHKLVQNQRGQVTLLQKQHDDRFKMQQQQHNEQVKLQQQQHTDQAKLQQQQHNEQAKLQQQQHNEQSKLQQQQQPHEQARLQQQHDAQAKIQQQQHFAQIELQQQQHEAQIELQQQQHEAQIELQQQQHDEQVELQQKQHDKQAKLQQQENQQLDQQQDNHKLGFSLGNAAFRLAQVHSWIGDFPASLKAVQLAKENDPHNSTIESYLRNVRHQVETAGPGQSHDDMMTWQRQWEWLDYERLCRGEVDNQVTSSVGEPLTCRYKVSRSLPYVVYKEETFSWSPRISILYDVISDRQIQKVLSLAKPILSRARVVGNKTTGVRVGKTSWLWDFDNPNHVDGEFVKKLSLKVSDITGLDTTYRSHASSSEALQVVNYGIGGQYEPHVDFIGDANHIPPPFLVDSGDRIVTFMFYLSQVTEGGATVFPDVGVRVPAIKGAAAFWYNADPTLEYDSSTLHAGCPVLVGEKWVANKWIRSNPQMFIRRCPKDPDALWD